MKRFNADTGSEEKLPNVDSFIEEVIELCKKYDLSIRHEDRYGAFEVYGKFDEDSASWLRSAYYIPSK